MARYKLISCKGSRHVRGPLSRAIEKAIEMEDELQPAFGVTVEDDTGATVAEVRDGAVEDDT